jgi:protein-S-isoprenylcysteine O-methyltransferase Ste14
MQKKIGRLIYKKRGLLMVPLVVFMVLCTWKEIENDALVFGLGGIVFGMGVCLRIWSQMHLQHRLKVHKILTTTGPYVYIRNPCYLANILILTGAAFLSELFWFAPLMLVYCAIVYSFVVRYEEAKLTKQYGTLYTEYFNRVPRWFPRSWPLQKTFSTKRREFLGPSISVEMHNLLLVIPFLIKEASSYFH